MQKDIVAALAAAAALVLGTSTALAQQTDGRWRFSIAPYLWAPSLNGALTVRGRESDIDASFADTLEKADTVFGLNGDVELSNGRWSFFAAPSYMNMTVDESAKVGPLTLGAEARTTLVFVEFGVGHRVAEWGNGGAHGSASGGNLELLAGARYSKLDAKIELDLPPAGVSRSVDKSTDWVDPFFGARARFKLSPHWAINLRGDVGGFGVGAHISLHGLATLGYEFDMFGHDATVFGGYKALYQDYSTGSGPSRFKWDMTTHGPILGLQMTF